METTLKRRRRLWWTLVAPVPTLLALAGGLVAGVRAQDAPGSHDHELVPRWPASWIEHFEEEESAEYELALGPLEKQGDHDTVAKGQTLVGKVTRILYRASDTSVSAAQMYFSYEARLRKTAEILSEARATTTRAPAGSAWVRKVYADLGDAVVDQLVTSSAPRQRRYLAAKLVRSDADFYVVMLVNQLAEKEVRMEVDVVEVRPPPSPS